MGCFTDYFEKVWSVNSLYKVEQPQGNQVFEPGTRVPWLKILLKELPAFREAHAKVKEYLSVSVFHQNAVTANLVYSTVDFVVFNGLNTNDKLENITFLSEKTENQALNKIRETLLSSVEKERYDWKTARIYLDGNIQLEQFLMYSNRS